MKLNIVSFNTQHCMNYVTRQIDYEGVAKLIKELDADIVGLNEMRGEGDLPGYEAQMEKLAELTGYHYFFAPAIMMGGTSPYGNGLLSRYPIKQAEKIMIPDPTEKTGKSYYETRCIIKAVIDVAEGLTVIVSHFGLNDDERFNAVNTLLPALEDKKCVFMGDLNTTPEDPVLDGIRARMLDTAEVIGEDKLSFPSDKPVEKIDYIFTSRDIEVTYADIPEKIVSDHRPYIVKVNI
ncbi:MAG: endonuclease/exonuclease/phosphatase family protein [Clostridia bacterium]|nr:endonuclease/exonuclease/phosphatase family protein [Clostridia bacterium]